jgi:hypothetical protein
MTPRQSHNVKDMMEIKANEKISEADKVRCMIMTAMSILSLGSVFNQVNNINGVHLEWPPRGIAIPFLIPERTMFRYFLHNLSSLRDVQRQNELWD